MAAADLEDRYFQAPLDGVDSRHSTRGRWSKIGIALVSGSAFVLLCVVGRTIDSAMIHQQVSLIGRMAMRSQGLASPVGKLESKYTMGSSIFRPAHSHATSVIPAQNQKRAIRSMAEPVGNLISPSQDTDPGITVTDMGEGIVRVSSDPGLKKLILTSASGATAQIYTLGATVTSFKAPNEVLFVRPDAKFDGSKPISGGLPFCWPQFGPGEIQQHGFARNCEWNVVSTKGGTSPSVTLELTQTKYTKDMWKYDFTNTYTITVGEDNTLKTTFTVANTGSEAFTFTGALHSYYAVGDIEETAVQGAFKGSTIFDRMVDPPTRTEEDRAEVTVSKATDRCYEGVNGVVKIADKANSRTIVIDNKAGYVDTCVWNPWDEAMGSKQFICVESGNVKDGVTVAPGASWVGEMTLGVE